MMKHACFYDKFYIFNGVIHFLVSLNCLYVYFLIHILHCVNILLYLKKTLTTNPPICVTPTLDYFNYLII